MKKLILLLLITYAFVLTIKTESTASIPMTKCQQQLTDCQDACTKLGGLYYFQCLGDTIVTKTAGFKCQCLEGM
jgi:hypothetical protein